METTGNIISVALHSMAGKDGETIKRERWEKYLQIGRSLA